RPATPTRLDQRRAPQGLPRQTSQERTPPRTRTSSPELPSVRRVGLGAKPLADLRQLLGHGSDLVLDGFAAVGPELLFEHGGALLQRFEAHHHAGTRGNTWARVRAVPVLEELREPLQPRPKAQVETGQQRATDQQALPVVDPVLRVGQQVLTCGLDRDPTRTADGLRQPPPLRRRDQAAVGCAARGPVTRISPPARGPDIAAGAPASGPDARAGTAAETTVAVGSPARGPVTTVGAPARGTMPLVSWNARAASPPSCATAVPTTTTSTCP